MPPVAPRLKACTACYCTKQHEIKSDRRENDAIKRRDKQETSEAAAGVAWHTVSQQTFFISRTHSKIMIKSLI